MKFQDTVKFFFLVSLIYTIGCNSVEKKDEGYKSEDVLKKYGIKKIETLDINFETNDTTKQISILNDNGYEIESYKLVRIRSGILDTLINKRIDYYDDNEIKSVSNYAGLQKEVIKEDNKKIVNYYNNVRYFQEVFIKNEDDKITEVKCFGPNILPIVEKPENSLYIITLDGNNSVYEFYDFKLLYKYENQKLHQIQKNISSKHEYVFDIKGNIISNRLIEIINDSAVVVNYTYDDSGRRTKMVANNKLKTITKEYTYHGDTEIIRTVNIIESHPLSDSKKSIYYYDTDGKSLKIEDYFTNPNIVDRIVEFKYDSRNLLIEIPVYNSGKSLLYTSKMYYSS